MPIAYWYSATAPRKGDRGTGYGTFSMVDAEKTESDGDLCTAIFVRLTLPFVTTRASNHESRVSQYCKNFLTVCYSKKNSNLDCRAVPNYYGWVHRARCNSGLRRIYAATAANS